VFALSAVVRAHGCTRASYDDNDRHRKTRKKGEVGEPEKKGRERIIRITVKEVKREAKVNE